MNLPFFPMRNHTCMDLFLSSGQLDASIAWEVSLHRHGNSRLCICRGLSDPSRTSDGICVGPRNWCHRLRASARRGIMLRMRTAEDSSWLGLKCYMEASCPTPPRHSALHFVAQKLRDGLAP
jgi:hypothetical protein